MTRGTWLAGRAWRGVVVLLLLASGCGRAGPEGGGGGGDGHADVGPRIVAFSPAVGVIVRDLGLAHRVVGRHDYDVVLDPGVPTVGHQEHVDYEALLRARPTHVFTQWGSRDLPATFVRLAGERGWVVLDVRLLSLDDVARGADEIAAALSPWVEPARAEPGARVLAAARRRGEGYASVGRVLLLGAVQPAGALGPGSVHHELLVRLGGVPALADGAAWVELSPEDVLRLSPDAVVLLQPRAYGEPPGATDAAAPALGVLAELETPAKRRGRFALIDHPLGLLPSTSMAEVCEELARVLEGWREGG